MLPFSLNINGHLYEYTHPVVMGILNVTPDSFYSDSRAYDESEIRRRVAQMIEEEVDIIDIGGYSSRPGSYEVSADEEKRRLELGMEALRKESADIIVSVDTFRAEVADFAVTNQSANIINDISGGNADNRMFETVARLNVPYILNHSRGTTPEEMQHVPEYNDFISDVVAEIAEKLEKLHLLGVNDIILDPGFGFSKSLEQNYLLLINLSAFQLFRLPLLVGVSRKSMITKLLDIKPEDALNGTTVINTIALQRGASILRVHDVKSAVQAVKIFNQLQNK